MNEPTESSGQSLFPHFQITIPEILKALESPGGHFPREAMQAAIEQREAITPELLRVVEAVAADPAGYAEREDYQLHLFAIFMLAQFREPRVYGPLVRICHHPEETVEALLGDIVTDGLNRIFASVYDGNPEPLQGLIENERGHEFARSAAISAFAMLVFTGQMPKDGVVAYFRSLFQGRLERMPSFVWDELVGCVADLRAPELLEDARQAYADELVDPMIVGFEDIERDAKRDPEPNPGDVLITDAMVEMEDRSEFPSGEWPAETEKFAEPPWELPPAESYEPPVPVRRAEPKIGRNESCPCGSGKKYKKCCGR